MIKVLYTHVRSKDYGLSKMTFNSYDDLENWWSIRSHCLYIVELWEVK